MSHSKIKDQFARMRERNHKLWEDHHLVLKHVRNLEKRVEKLEANLDFAQSRITALVKREKERRKKNG